MRSLINKPLLMEQLKRFWAISILSGIAYLIGIVLPILSMGNYESGTQVTWFTRELLNMTYPIILITMIVVPFSVVMTLYPYYFSSNSSMAFYAFPVTKRQHFWTNVVAAKILMFVPLLLMCIFVFMYPVYEVTTNAIGIEIVGERLNTLAVVAVFFARLVVGYTFYYTVFLLAVSVSGERAVSVLLCVAVPYIPIGFYFLGQGIANMYVFGFPSTQIGNNIGAIIIHITNPVWWGSSLENWYFMAYIAIIAALFAISYYCGNTRKQERTGNSIVFAALNKVLIFLLALTGMIFLGLILVAMMDNLAALYFGFVLGFVIAYFVAQMISEKTFNVSHKVKALRTYGGVIIGLYVAMLIFTNLGLRFYVNRVPEQSEVVGVYLGEPWRWRHVEQVPFGIHVTDPDIVARTLEIHQSVIDDRDGLHSFTWGVSSWTFNVMYLLQDGSIMNRQYQIYDSVMIEEIRALLEEPEVLLSEHPILSQLEVLESLRVNIWNSNWEERVGVTITGHDDIVAFIDMAKADFLESPRNSYEDDIWVDINFNVDERWHIGYNPWVLAFDGGSGNVMEWLRQNGYLT